MMSKRITLTAWARAKLDPPPCPRTLQRWVRNCNIEPAPVKIGRAYYVDPDARCTIGKAITAQAPAPLPAHQPASFEKKILSMEEIRKLEEICLDAGVYFLFLEGVLQYIGMSRCVFIRIYKHDKEARISFDEARCLGVDNDDWRAILEQEHIAHYRPPFNKAFTNRKPQLATP